MDRDGPGASHVSAVALPFPLLAGLRSGRVAFDRGGGAGGAWTDDKPPPGRLLSLSTGELRAGLGSLERSFRPSCFLAYRTAR